MISAIKHLIIGTVFLLFSVSHLHADHHVKIPAELEAKLILTALAYDRNLVRNGADEFVLGVFYLKNSSESEKEAKIFFETLSAYKDKLIRGLRIKTFLYGYETVADFKQKAKTMSADSAYITATKKTLLEEITGFTRKESILTITGNVSYVKENRLSIAVGAKDEKPRIYLNLNSAIAEGADFDSRFLRVADIVK